MVLNCIHLKYSRENRGFHKMKLYVLGNGSETQDEGPAPWQNVISHSGC